MWAILEGGTGEPLLGEAPSTYPPTARLQPALACLLPTPHNIFRWEVPRATAGQTLKKKPGLGRGAGHSGLPKALCSGSQGPVHAPGSPKPGVPFPRRLDLGAHPYGRRAGSWGGLVPAW